MTATDEQRQKVSLSPLEPRKISKHSALALSAFLRATDDMYLYILSLMTPICTSASLDCRCVDLRTVSYEVPPQEMLSRDSVTVSVDAVCFYKISNPLAAVCNVGNYTHSTNLLVATSLRNVLGTKTLAEILSERETICHVMEHILDEATRPWGVKVSTSST